MLVKKIICRSHTPNNSETDARILSVTKKNLGKYLANSIPNIGDIIRYTNNKHYDVLNVIHETTFNSDYSSMIEGQIIVEVCEHSNRHLFQNGNIVFDEEIPLVTEIPDCAPIELIDDLDE